MKRTDELARENEALRDRLSRLSEASLRINESLDFDTVLQEVLDNACSLTGARYGVITLFDDTGAMGDFLAHGLTGEQAQQLWELPEGLMFFEYLSRITGPLRVGDFAGHTRSLGLPEFHPPPLGFIRFDQTLLGRHQNKSQQVPSLPSWRRG